MESCGCRDPIFQIEAGKAFDLKRMVMFNERDEELDMKD
jgi:hypothetical protein